MIKALAQSLSRSEQRKLCERLDAAPDGPSLAWVSGHLTAVASAPTMRSPSDWLGEIVGGIEFVDEADVNLVAGLLIRLYNGTIAALDRGAPVVPDLATDEAECADWCAGYLAAVDLDPRWAEDEVGFAMTLPLGVLSGALDLTGEEDDAGQVIEDPSRHIARYRADLAAIVLELDRYWSARQPPPSLAPIARPAPKVGRNEPCPCGSGKKWKRCCAQALH